MNTSLFNQFKEQYDAFRLTDAYSLRVKQFAIVDVHKNIIQETLKKEPLLNEHLTGLIQMFKVDCSKDTFNKYLEINIIDPHRRKEITDRINIVNQTGYTGAGLNAINNLTESQLAVISAFLKKAFSINSIDDAIQICSEFDKKDIPLVKSGVYSPWLYYINPQLFPIINNSSNKFREWIGIPSDYPSCIKDFSTLKSLVNENDFGLLDMFAFNFEKNASFSEGIKVLNLNGHAFYKISHGIFKKNKDFRDTGIIDVLEKNNWICLHSETGKNQGSEFKDGVNIDDYVYICYGGDELYCIGKIISEAKFLDDDLNKMINEDGKWIYRVIEPLFFPEERSVQELKDDKRLFMPSGNSTFKKVPSENFNEINQKIFIPKYGIEIVDSTVNKTVMNYAANELQSKKIPLNTILYGPPGTGKTFHSINYAVAIVERIDDVKSIMDEKRKHVKNRFADYINEGRIAFCTFHQSMSYEDFIEGIKPLPPNDDDRNTLSYDIRDGLFIRMCVEATYNFIEMNSLYDEKFSELLSFNELYDQLVDEISSAGEMELTTINQSKVTVTVSDRGNIEVKHVNGERTYTVSRERLSLLYERYPDLKGINNIVTDFRNIIGGCNATAFWSVLNKMVSMKQSNKLADQVKDPVAVDYKQKAKVVKEYWKKKEQYPVDFQDKSKPFVLIIDEINRGNVSQIFGELVTLIEDDKRIGKAECLYVDLPYSQKSFSVPPNLHIIGTMNTADRSVEALDTALRRRFAFEPIMPDLNKLDAEFENINVRKLLETLNNRLRILKDNDHTIGHAWLMGVDDLDGLRNVFKNKILPLLQEYFYNDYEKLGLVLGDAFFKLPHKHVDGKEFAKFTGSNGLSSQYRNKYVYELKNVDDSDDDSDDYSEDYLKAKDFSTLCPAPIANDE